MLLSGDPGGQALGDDLSSQRACKERVNLPCGVLRQAMVHVEMTRRGLLTFFARMKQPGALFKWL
jgi:hypothetical protein